MSAGIYRTVYASFWTARTGREIKRHGRALQVLAFYLVTSPHANLAGLFYLPIAYISADTGLDDKTIRRGLADLECLKFATYDAAAEWVFVVEGFRFQCDYGAGSARDNRIKAALAIFNEAPATLRTLFAERYGSPFEPPSKPLGSPLEGTGGIEIGIETTDRDSRQKTETPAGAGAPSPVSPLGLMKVWNETVTRLPKCERMSTGRAKHASARLKEEPDLDTWRTAIGRLDASDFAAGDNDRGWTASIDFLIQPDTLAKIGEGKYDNRTATPTTKGERRMADWLAKEGIQ